MMVFLACHVHHFEHMPEEGPDCPHYLAGMLKLAFQRLKLMQVTCLLSKRSCSSSSFWAGRQRTISAVSISTPKNTSLVVGPSSFSVATGIFRSLKIARKVVRCSAHFIELGAPTKRKSSSYHPLSANELKILRADWSPNRRAVSTYNAPSHIIPSNGCHRDGLVLFGMHFEYPP